MQPTLLRTTKARISNKMNREFELLSEDMTLLYMGVIHGERLEKEDIDTDKNTYLEIMGKVKYISFSREDKNGCAILMDNKIYLFSDYLENTMDDKERDIIIIPQIIDKEGNKIAWEKWEKRMSRSKQYYFGDNGEVNR